MHAARNTFLCTKDCVCLFVCPTGATDTENGQIDCKKCIDGCRLCIDACPSHAIYLVYNTYPDPQKKSIEVKKALHLLSASKAKQEKIASDIAEETKDPLVRQLARTIERSNRILGEDCLRESGYMIPQSKETQSFLINELEKRKLDKDFPKDVAEKLLELLFAEK